jgi:hypothetical protein
VSDEKVGNVRIQGTFLGHPIDVTICEDAVTEDTPDAPDFPCEPDTPEVPPAPVTGLDASAEGEVVPADEIETPSSDPAPEAAPVSEDPPNPAGNAEQL